MFQELEKYKKDKPHSIQVTELKIKIPTGGHMSGKWWGNLNTKPILCLHGWQDNAGTFDRLIPLLPKDFSFLAIDFVGHGRSSLLPRGVMYHVSDYVYAILYVMKELKWEKVSLMGHSMGAMVAFLFSSLFPDKVDLLIKIDSFKNLDRTLEDEMRDTRENYLNFMIADEKMETSVEPPSYSIDEMIEKVNTGSFYNISTDSAPYLLERNIVRSTINPEKFYFSRDLRLRFVLLISHPEEVALQSAKYIKAPFLFFTTKKFSPLYAKMKYFDKLIAVFKENPKFRLEIVDSDSHYFHLNDPASISEAISEFLIENKKLVHHL